MISDSAYKHQLDLVNNNKLKNEFIVWWFENLRYNENAIAHAGGISGPELSEAGEKIFNFFSKAMNERVKDEWKRMEKIIKNFDWYGRDTMGAKEFSEFILDIFFSKETKQDE